MHVLESVSPLDREKRLLFLTKYFFTKYFFFWILSEFILVSQIGQFGRGGCLLD